MKNWNKIASFLTLVSVFIMILFYYWVAKSGSEINLPMTIIMISIFVGFISVIGLFLDKDWSKILAAFFLGITVSVMMTFSMPYLTSIMVPIIGEAVLFIQSIRNKK